MKLVDHTSGRVHEYEGQSVEQLKEMAKALKTDHFSIQNDDGNTVYRELEGEEVVKAESIPTDELDKMLDETEPETDGEDDAA